MSKSESAKVEFDSVKINLARGTFPQVKIDDGEPFDAMLFDRLRFYMEESGEPAEEYIEIAGTGDAPAFVDRIQVEGSEDRDLIYNVGEEEEKDIKYAPSGAAWVMKFEIVSIETTETNRISTTDSQD